MEVQIGGRAFEIVGAPKYLVRQPGARSRTETGVLRTTLAGPPRNTAEIVLRGPADGEPFECEAAYPLSQQLSGASAELEGRSYTVERAEPKEVQGAGDRDECTVWCVLMEA